MQITPNAQETTVEVACLNGVKEQIKLSDQDLSVLSARLMLIVSKKLHDKEAQDVISKKYDPKLLERLDYPAR